MLTHLVTFAGPICLNPNTERESFIWLLFIGGFLLFLLSLIFCISAIIFKLRHTVSALRITWAKRYGLSVFAFFALMALGWLVGTGGSNNDTCRTARSSLQGEIISQISVLTILVAILTLIGFMFSFAKKPTRNK